MSSSRVCNVPLPCFYRCSERIKHWLFCIFGIFGQLPKRRSGVANFDLTTICPLYPTNSSFNAQTYEWCCPSYLLLPRLFTELWSNSFNRVNRSIFLSKHKDCFIHYIVRIINVTKKHHFILVMDAVQVDSDLQ